MNSHNKLALLSALGGAAIAVTLMLAAATLGLFPQRLEGAQIRSYLLAHPGRVQSRERLIQAVWGSNFFGDRKTVDVHVRWIREKFEGFAALPFRITTVFGVGYRLDRLEDVTAPAEAGG